MAENLPEIFLLSVFGKLNAQDRFSSSLVCPAWSARVREVNKDVRSLTVIAGQFPPTDYIMSLILYESVNLLFEAEMEADWEGNQERWTTSPSSDQGVWTPTSSSEANTLHFTSSSIELDSTTVQQMMAVFPSVTELKFSNATGDEPTKWECLTEMLGGHKVYGSPWRFKLSSLTIMDQSGDITDALLEPKTSRRLFKAINRNLPKLKQLAIVLDNARLYQKGLHLHPLPVLAQLREIRFKQDSSSQLDSFFWYVREYAQHDNKNLRIDLFNGMTGKACHVGFLERKVKDWQRKNSPYGDYDEPRSSMVPSIWDNE